MNRKRSKGSTALTPLPKSAVATSARERADGLAREERVAQAHPHPRGTARAGIVQPAHLHRARREARPARSRRARSAPARRCSGPGIAGRPPQRRRGLGRGAPRGRAERAGRSRGRSAARRRGSRRPAPARAARGARCAWRARAAAKGTGRSSSKPRRAIGSSRPGSCALEGARHQRGRRAAVQRRGVPRPARVLARDEQLALCREDDAVRCGPRGCPVLTRASAR